MNPTQESGNAGGVKSGYSFKRPYIYRPESIDHVRRVEYDSGVLQTNRELDEFIRTCQEIGIYDSLEIAYDASFGIKTRISGSNTFVSKAYNLPNTNDAIQTTSTSQPHLGNTIAPNERPSFKNQNGQSNFLTHPTISFAANQEWTVHTVVGWNGTNTSDIYIFGNGAVTTLFSLKSGGNNRYYFRNTLIQSILGTSGGTNKLIGKTSIISFVADGTGTLRIYENGILVETKSIITSIELSRFILGYTSDGFAGTYPLHTIFNRAHTPTQIAQFANYLKVKYPEIPTVRIGNDDWATSNCEMVTTPMGNPIQNVTENGLVEKITQPINISTGWSTFSATINNANTFTTSAIRGSIFRAFVTIDRYYKINIVASASAGNVAIKFAGAPGDLIANTSINTTIYAKATSGTLEVVGLQSGAIITVTTLSVQEIGWSASTELYDAIYAATAGTVEQKTYAAVKAAAMWCFYNNDANLGAIYGKLYNWYAVKLLQMDIDYYNAANPSTPWGFKVPADTDFTNAANALGGAAVAGGKMKVGGTTYFNAPNTGGDNSSGFSAIGGGLRTDSSGAFTGTLINARFWSINGYRLNCQNDSASITLIDVSANKGLGYSLRLVKS